MPLSPEWSFCILPLYWICFLDLTILWWSFNGFLCMRLYYPHIVLFLSFQSGSLCLFSLSDCPAQGGWHGLHRSGESGLPCAVADLRRETLSFSLLSLMFTVGFHTDLHFAEVWSSHPQVADSVYYEMFILNEWCIFSKVLSASIQASVCFISFTLLLQWKLLLVSHVKVFLTIFRTLH